MKAFDKEQKRKKEEKCCIFILRTYQKKHISFSFHSWSIISSL